MPTLDDLNTLKSQVNRLGDEPRLLAERGETMSDVAPPEAAFDSDLESLLADDGPAAGTMDDLLDSYAEGEPGIPESDLSASEDEAFSLDDLEGLEGIAGLDDLDGSDGLDDLDGIAGLDDLDDLAASEESGEGIDAGESDIPGGPDDFVGFGDDDFPADADGIGEPGDESVEADLLSGLDDLIGTGEPGGPEGVDDLGGVEDLDFSDDFEVSDDLEAFTEDDDSGESDDLAGLDAFMEPGAAGDFDEPDAAADFDEPGGAADFDEPDIAADSDEPGAVPADDFSIDDLDFGDAVEEVPAEVAADEPAEDDVFSLEDLSSDDDFELPGEGGEESDEAGMEEVPEEVTAAAAPAEPGSDDEEPAGLEDLEPDAGEFSNAGFTEDEFSLDDLSFDESPEEGSDEEIAGLEDLGGFEESEAGDDGEMPDIEAAVESLGGVDAMDEGMLDELSLDEDLNFEEELGADVLSDIQEAGDDTSQFSMDDFGDQYNFQEGEGGYADNLGVDLEQLEQSLDEASEDEKKPFGLEEEDLNDILQTLATLPRNLKIAVEELLADERRNIDDL